MGLENFLNDRITEEDSYNYTLPEILQYRAGHTPDETAFIFLKDGENDEDKITYLELDQAAASLADKLLEMGLRGERALMLIPTSIDFIKALFGCFYAGVIAVPAYPPKKNRSIDRLRLQVIDSGASIILTNEDIYKNFERSFSDITELKKLTWLTIDKPNLPASPLPRLHAPMPSDIALLQYTSGSTGQPKGVMVTHRNIMRNDEYIRQSFELSRKSASVTWLPSFHDMGLIDGILEPVYTGFPGVFMYPLHFLQKPSRWLKAMTKYKVTHTGGPNFAFDFCVDEVSDEEKEGIDLSSLHTLYCGAEPIYKETFERFIKAYEHLGFYPKAFYPCYGMAETTLIITGPKAGQGYNYLAISDKEFSKNRITPVNQLDKGTKYIVSVGFPWIDTVVRIVNPDTFRSCGDDEIGEVWVKGSIVTAGYWNNKEETVSKFEAVIEDEPGDRYLRTGDLGFFNNGELYISGRLKDLIIIHGFNTYPQDIERLAEESHPALRANSSAAFSVNIDREEKLIIVAEVERSAIRNLDVEEICENIRMKIAEEKELSVYGIQLLRTASILKTSSGKIQRKACRQAFLEKSLEVIGESFIGNYHNTESDPVMEDGLVNMQAWLMVWIQMNLNIPLEQIDLSRPISIYGPNFPQINRLQYDFLERFNIELSPFQIIENIPVNELCIMALKMKTGK